MQFRRDVHAQMGDEGHADGGRERLGERPQVGERFAGVEPRALYVVSLLHRLEADQRPRRVAVEHRLGLLLRRAPGHVRPREGAAAGTQRGPRGPGRIRRGRPRGVGSAGWRRRTRGRRRGAGQHGQRADQGRQRGGVRRGSGSSSNANSRATAFDLVPSPPVARSLPGGSAVVARPLRRLSGRRGLRLRGRRARHGGHPPRGRAPGRRHGLLQRDPGSEAGAQRGRGDLRGTR